MLFRLRWGHRVRSPLLPVRSSPELRLTSLETECNNTVIEEFASVDSFKAALVCALTPQISGRLHSSL